MILKLLLDFNSKCIDSQYLSSALVSTKKNYQHYEVEFYPFLFWEPITTCNSKPKA